MLPFYVVVNIGCIECGVSSNIVGVFSLKETANELCEILQNSKEAGWRESGQNSYEVFEVTEFDSINLEYLQYLGE